MGNFTNCYCKKILTQRASKTSVTVFFVEFVDNQLSKNPLLIDKSIRYYFEDQIFKKIFIAK